MAALNVLSGDLSSPGTVSRLELAELVGVRPPAHGAVIWVFRDQDDRWCVRQEGGRVESFAGRDQAVQFARRVGEVAGPYRLFLEGTDGRFVQEFGDPDCGCGQDSEGNTCVCR
jgi:hypothetical protein